MTTTATPTVPASLLARLDEAIRRAVIAAQRAPHVPPIHEPDPARAWAEDAHAALVREIAEYVADRERWRWLVSPMYSWEAARKIEAVAAAFREAYPNGGLTADEALAAAIDAARSPSTQETGSDG
jgi:hypothetical protein